MIEPRLTLSLQLVDGQPPLIVSGKLDPDEVALLTRKPGPDWKRDEHLDAIVNALKVRIRLQLEARKVDES